MKYSWLWLAGVVLGASLAAPGTLRSADAATPVPSGSAAIETPRSEPMQRSEPLMQLAQRSSRRGRPSGGSRWSGGRRSASPRTGGYRGMPRTGGYRGSPRFTPRPGARPRSGVRYPRLRARGPGYTYFYGGWWYPFPWWLGTVPYSYGPPPVSDQCVYWHERCADQWGYPNANYNGCMRYHGCD